MILSLHLLSCDSSVSAKESPDRNKTETRPCPLFSRQIPLVILAGFMIFFNISGFYKDVFVNSFFPCTSKLRNSLPAECSSLTDDLNGFKCRVDNHLPYAFYLCFPVFQQLYALRWLFSHFGMNLNFN